MSTNLNEDEVEEDEDVDQNQDDQDIKPMSENIPENFTWHNWFTSMVPMWNA